MLSALALIALGVGYVVFVSAAKEKDGLRMFGQAVAIFILFFSMIFFVYGFCPKSGGSCSKSGKFSGKSYWKTQGQCPLEAQARQLDN